MRTVIEGRRGCGYREPGGLYLLSDGPWRECALLPIELTVCPVCHGGIKPSRGWTWINPQPFVLPQAGTALDPSCGLEDCPRCWTAWGERCGLLWIGSQHYKTPLDWLRETAAMGASRRIPVVPKGFELGETWVLVAHREAVATECPECRGQATVEDEETGQRVPCPAEGCKAGTLYRPGIFSAFKPTRLEYVVRGTETEEELAALEKRGVEPVKVERAAGPLFEGKA